MEHASNLTTDQPFRLFGDLRFTYKFHRPKYSSQINIFPMFNNNGRHYPKQIQFQEFTHTAHVTRQFYLSPETLRPQRPANFVRPSRSAITEHDAYNGYLLAGKQRHNTPTTQKLFVNSREKFRYAAFNFSSPLLQISVCSH